MITYEDRHNLYRIEQVRTARAAVLHSVMTSDYCCARTRVWYHRHLTRHPCARCRNSRLRLNRSLRQSTESSTASNRLGCCMVGIGDRGDICCAVYVPRRSRLCRIYMAASYCCCPAPVSIELAASSMRPLRVLCCSAAARASSAAAVHVRRLSHCFDACTCDAKWLTLSPRAFIVKCDVLGKFGGGSCVAPPCICATVAPSRHCCRPRLVLRAPGSCHPAAG